MTASLLETLGTQMRFVLQFEARDAPKRIAATLVVGVVMAYFGQPREAVIAVSSILIGELLVRTQVWRLPPDGLDYDRRSVLLPLSMLMLNELAYCLPAIFLVQSDRNAANIAAFIWLGGFLVHAAGVHAMIKVWSWLAIVPPAVATLICSVLLYEGVPAPPGEYDRLFLYVGAVLTTANTIEVVLRQRENRRAFSEAQVAAGQRLRQLKHLAEHDPLTGLPNRHAFDAYLDDVLRQATAAAPAAVMLIDIDRFKPINDTHGHAAGDQVLRDVALRLEALAGKRNTARLGGDEFAVILPDASDPDAAEALARAIMARLAEPIDHEWQEFTIGASVGLAFGHGGTDTVESLCVRADRAMYRAKEAQAGSPEIDRPDWMRRTAG